MSDRLRPEPVHNPEPGKTSSLGFVLLGGAVVGVLMALGVIVFGSSRSPNQAPTPIPDLVQVGLPAPDFTARLPGGADISLVDYRGSVVAVNFWATWCVPCKVEMPVLEEAYRRGKLVVLGVNAGESESAVTAFVDELDLTFPVLLDPNGAIIDLYAVRVFPTTVLVGRDGLVLAEHLGPLTPELIDQYLEEAKDS